MEKTAKNQFVEGYDGFERRGCPVTKINITFFVRELFNKYVSPPRKSQTKNSTKLKLIYFIPYIELIFWNNRHANWGIYHIAAPVLLYQCCRTICPILWGTSWPLISPPSRSKNFFHPYICGDWEICENPMPRDLLTDGAARLAECG